MSFWGPLSHLSHAGEPRGGWGCHRLQLVFESSYMDSLAGQNYPTADSGLSIKGKARFPVSILPEEKPSLVTDAWLSATQGQFPHCSSTLKKGETKTSHTGFAHTSSERVLILTSPPEVWPAPGWVAPCHTSPCSCKYLDVLRGMAKLPSFEHSSQQFIFTLT